MRKSCALQRYFNFLKSQYLIYAPLLILYASLALCVRLSAIGHSNFNNTLFQWFFGFFWDTLYNSVVSNVYNMSGRVVSDIQTRAEGESLYIRYNTDANVVNNLKNDPSYEFIGEVILKINVV